jgi:uncharacterized protein YhaN
MKINKIEIGAFGKLSDFAMDFQSGLQIVYGGNEYGKTTLMEFIKLMFYGKQETSRMKNPRKRYAPWSGSPISGALEIQLDKTAYRIQSSFGDVPSKDRHSLINLSTGIDEYASGEEMGYKFFGMDLAGFEQLCFIGGVGRISAPANYELPSLSEEPAILSNLMKSGDETISQQDTISRLMSAKEELISKSGKKGLLVEARISLTRLEDEKAQLEDLSRKQKHLLSEFNKTKQLLQMQKELRSQIEILDELEKADKLRELAEMRAEVLRKGKHLVKPNIALERIPFFLEKFEQAANNYIAAEEAAAELPADDLDELADVSDEEMAKIEAMHNSINALALIEEHLETSVLPIAQECKARYQKYAENKASLAEVKHELSEIDMGERLPIYFELDPFMCVFICMTLAMVFVLPAVLVSYWFFALEVIPIFLALDHFVIKLGAFYFLYRLFGGKKIRPIKKIMDRRSSLEEVEVREAIERLKYEKELATDEFMQSRAEFLSSVRQYRLWADRVSPLLEAEGFSILPDIAEEDVLKTVVTQAKEIAISEEALREVERSTRCLKLERQGLARELEDVVYSKGCESYKDLQENYLRIKASTKNKSAVSSLKMKLSDRRARLCKIASVYEFSMTAEKALSLFSKLKNGYDEYERKLREVEYKASGMGLADSSLEYLETVLDELEEKRVLIKDSPEYLKASWEKVKEEDYGNRLLELQKNIQTPTRSIEQVDRDMKEAREHISEMAVKYKALGVALEVMNESIEEMNTEFGPALNIATGKILSSITNGAYKNALVSKELDVSVKDGVLYRASDYLSNGSIDQVYLALRLALCDVAVKDGVYPPAFLDDVLMQYDDERTESCLRFLAQYAKERSRQILLFTCHGNLVDQAEKTGTHLMAI